MIYVNDYVNVINSNQENKTFEFFYFKQNFICIV